MKKMFLLNIVLLCSSSLGVILAVSQVNNGQEDPLLKKLIGRFENAFKKKNISDPVDTSSVASPTIKQELITFLNTELAMVKSSQQQEYAALNQLLTSSTIDTNTFNSWLSMSESLFNSVISYLNIAITDSNRKNVQSYSTAIDILQTLYASMTSLASSSNASWNNLLYMVQGQITYQASVMGETSYTAGAVIGLIQHIQTQIQVFTNANLIAQESI